MPEQTVTKELTKLIAGGTKELGRVIENGGEQLAQFIENENNTPELIAEMSEKVIKDISDKGVALEHQLNEYAEKAIAGNENNAQAISQTVKGALADIRGNVNNTVSTMRQVVDEIMR